MKNIDKKHLDKNSTRDFSSSVGIATSKNNWVSEKYNPQSWYIFICLTNE